MLKTDDLQAGLWLPGDGVADAQLICQSLLDAARQKGMIEAT